jgi:hypothetical protein
VTTGWRGSHEANEVRFDPSRIDVATMEERLRRAHTYIKTLSDH